MNGPASNQAQPPWWLETGPEHCEFCLHSHYYEAVYHCVGCDRPMCPVCVIELRETHTLICSECAEER